MIKRLLVLEPELRLGSKDVSEIKNHAFFRGINWETLRKSPAPIIPQQHLPNATNFEGRKKFEKIEQKEPFYQKLGEQSEEKAVISLIFKQFLLIF